MSQRIPYSDFVAQNLTANVIGNGSVSNTEFEYLDGVSSGIQDQINSKPLSFW